ncbi:MAG TPA: LCP family protein [Solirubrobacterales bacterium]|jgi:LCP family protein required for cell wall assembly|nr:LCP family protein [Solirubrobacterales bacterium]
MPDDGAQRPEGSPEYNVYRSRKGFLSRLRSPDLSRLRKGSGGEGEEPPGRGREPGGGPGPRLPWRRRRGEPALERPRRGISPRRVAKWVALAALGWILLSFLAFAVSAQIQSFKLSGEAKETLHGNPFLLPSAQTILVLGTDARPPDTKEPGAPHKQKCFEQQSRGDAPHDGCEAGEYRADTLLLIRAGGGSFRKLSIPRDSFAEIPGQAPTKINAAFAFGGAALQVKTIENFLGIEIDHLAIVDFTGFEDLIDAVGGVEVDVPHKLCAEISGGAGGGQGGTTLRLHKGENTLDGEKALAYARVREPSECPGPGKSAYTLGYSDIDREKAQQSVINGVKDRLTDPLRLPYNFIRGPIIGWDAPKAFVSDMGFFTMPQLILAAAIGGGSTADVLCGHPKEGCGEGPEGSIEVSESARRAAAHRLIDG